MGGKEPELGLFIRKGDQVQSPQLSQGSQICPLLRDDDCEPGLYFYGGRPHARSSPLRAGRRGCVVSYSAPLPSERKHQERRNQVSAHKGSNAPVMGALHADLARLGTIRGLLVSAKPAQTPGPRRSRALSLSAFKSPSAWAHLPALGTSTSKLRRGKYAANVFKPSSALRLQDPATTFPDLANFLKNLQGVSLWGNFIFSC